MSDDRIEHYLRAGLAKAKEDLQREIEARDKAIAQLTQDMIIMCAHVTYHVRKYGPMPSHHPNGAITADECGNCHEQTRRADEHSPWVHANGPACWPGIPNSPEAIPLSLMGPIDPAGVPGINQCPGCLAATPGPHSPGCPVAASERQAAMEQATSNGAPPAVGAAQ